MGGMWMSPVDGGDFNVGVSGGSLPRPWWSFPTPLGVAKQTTAPHVCFQERVTPMNEAYGQPVMCGPLWGVGGHVYTDGTPWYSWFR